MYVNGSVINTVHAASNPTPTFSHYARAVPVPHRGRGQNGGILGGGCWMGCGWWTMLHRFWNHWRYPLPTPFSHYARAVPVPLRASPCRGGGRTVGDWAAVGVWFVAMAGVSGRWWWGKPHPTGLYGRRRLYRGRYPLPIPPPGPCKMRTHFAWARPLRFAAGERTERRAGFILPSRRRGLCRGRSGSGRVPVGCGCGCRRSGWR